jgi:FxLD family lantipeptide
LPSATSRSYDCSPKADRTGDTTYDEEEKHEMAANTATLNPPELHQAGLGTAEVDPFDLDLTVVTEIGADRIPVACGTGDGCAATCASSCASAV